MTTKKPNGSTKIYLDMDGVLADFFGEWATLAGVTTGNWKDIPPAKIDPTLDKMIGTDFFNRLPKFPTTNALVSMVLKYTGEYHINSSPLRGDHENSGSWKKVWIKRELNPQPVSIVITGRKESYAVNRDGSPNILIDDRGANIDAWTIKGGIGIKYQADENTIAEVRARLDKFFNVMPEVPVVTDTTDDITEGAEQKMSSEQMLAKLSKEMQGTHTGAPDPSSDWSKYVLSHKGFTLKDIQVDKIPTAVKSDGMSQANIEKYKKADTTKFPPVVIGDNGYLLDGNHRLQAYKYQGIKTIKAYIGESTFVEEIAIHKSTGKIGDIDLTKSADGTFWLASPDARWDSIVRSGEGVDNAYEISSEAKLATWDDIDKYSTDELEQMGYDGVRMDDGGGDITYQIWNTRILKPLELTENFPERVEFDVSGNKDKGYVLNKILVPKDLRDTGIGTKAMKDFIAKADAEDAIIALTPSNAFGGAKLRLIHFYKRFGFVLNKGRNKDFRYRETMIRYPTNYKVEGRQITELFNSAYNWNWQSNDTNYAVAQFDTDDGGTVTVQFVSASPGSPNFEVGFKKGISVTRSGEGDEFKIFATVIDTIQEFMLSRPTVESISFVAKREGKALDGPHIRDSRAELYKRMVTKFANKHNMEFTWQVIARMTEFILRRKVTGVNEALDYTQPDFDAEWEEAERYPKFKEMGKEEWIKLASKGKSINIDDILSNLIGNTEAGEKFRHTWNNLEPAKKKRFLQALKKEKIELPLIARFPDNKLELIGGNTRLTGLMLNKGKARAWIFNA